MLGKYGFIDKTLTINSLNAIALELRYFQFLRSEALFKNLVEYSRPTIKTQ